MVMKCIPVDATSSRSKGMEVFRTPLILLASLCILLVPPNYVSFYSCASTVNEHGDTNIVSWIGVTNDGKRFTGRKDIGSYGGTKLLGENTSLLEYARRKRKSFTIITNRFKYSNDFPVVRTLLSSKLNSPHNEGCHFEKRCALSGGRCECKLKNQRHRVGAPILNEASSESPNTHNVRSKPLQLQSTDKNREVSYLSKSLRDPMGDSKIVHTSTQIFLDRKCGEYLGSEAAIFRRKSSDTKLYCALPVNVDDSKLGGYCVTDCLTEANCYGELLEVEHNEDIETMLHDALLANNLGSCVFSELHRVFETSSCHDGRKARYASGEWICEYQSRLDKNSLSECVKNCGQLKECYGTPSFPFIRVAPPTAEQKWTYCICDEYANPESPSDYRGCQMVTSRGLSCKERAPCRAGNDFFGFACETDSGRDVCNIAGGIIYVQNDTSLDITIKGNQMSDKMMIRIFETHPNVSCGAADTEHPVGEFVYDIHSLGTPAWEDGKITRTLWSDIKVGHPTGSSYRVCGCIVNEYTIVDGREYSSCEHSANFSHWGPVLIPTGPIIQNIKTVRTLGPQTITVEGYDFDDLDIIQVSQTACDDTHTRGLESPIDIERHGTPNIILHTRFAQISSVSGNLLSGRTEVFHIPYTGEYWLCWFGYKFHYEARLPITQLIVKGIDGNQKLHLHSWIPADLIVTGRTLNEVDLAKLRFVEKDTGCEGSMLVELNLSQSSTSSELVARQALVPQYMLGDDTKRNVVQACYCANNTKENLLDCDEEVYTDIGTLTISSILPSAELRYAERSVGVSTYCAKTSMDLLIVFWEGRFPVDNSFSLRRMLQPILVFIMETVMFSNRIDISVLNSTSLTPKHLLSILTYDVEHSYPGISRPMSSVIVTQETVPPLVLLFVANGTTLSSHNISLLLPHDTKLPEHLDLNDEGGPTFVSHGRYVDGTDVYDRIFVIENNGLRVKVCGLQLQTISTTPSSIRFLQPESITCGDIGREKTLECFVTDSALNTLQWFALTQIGGVEESLSFVYNYKPRELKTMNGEILSTALDRPAAAKVITDVTNTNQALLYVGQHSDPWPSLFQCEISDKGDPYIDFYSKLGQGGTGGVDIIEYIDLFEDGTKKGKYLFFLKNDGHVQRKMFVDIPNTGAASTFFYTTNSFYRLDETIKLTPLMLSTLDPPALYTEERLAEGLTLDPSTGLIEGIIRSMPDTLPGGLPKYNIIIRGWGAVNVEQTEINFYVLCEDGQYSVVDPHVNETICINCPVGSYTNKLLVETDTRFMISCQECEENLSTAAHGSRAKENCVCAPGYDQGDDGECYPCAEGQWKSAAGNVGCQGVCFPNSESTVTGATTALERQCECIPGTYFVPGPGQSIETTDDTEGSCVTVPEGMYSNGGHHAVQSPCPSNSITMQDGATDISSCVCKDGCTPVDEQLLDTTGSQENLFYLASLVVYPQMTKVQACVLCPKGTYKDVGGHSPCNNCPLNSTTASFGSTRKSDCNSCDSGYYFDQSSEECTNCPKNHYCPGLMWDPDHWQYENRNKAIECAFKSTTVAPNTQNTFNKSCMCIPGYWFVSLTSDNTSVLCEPAPQETYVPWLGNTPPVHCEGGATTRDVGATSSMECYCAPGEYWIDDHCEECPIGFFCEGTRDIVSGAHRSKQACKDFRTLSTTSKGGMSSTDDCVCEIGYYLNTTLRCEQCPLGTYKDQLSNTLCYHCPQNSKTVQTGANSVSLCECFPGYHFVNDNCMECPADDYYCVGGADESGAPEKPRECPEFSQVPNSIAEPESPDDCHCKPGYETAEAENTKACVKCSSGLYKGTLSNDRCNTQCAKNASSYPGSVSIAQCFCLPDFYYLLGDCEPCPTGAICQGGFVPEVVKTMEDDCSFQNITQEDHVKPVPQHGYYAMTLGTPELTNLEFLFLQCPVKNACVEDEGCSSTMDGFICGECKLGYTNAFFSHVCTPCPPLSLNIAVQMITFMISVLFIILMTYINVAAGLDRKTIHSIVIKIASNYYTCITILLLLDFSAVSLPSSMRSTFVKLLESFSNTSNSYYSSPDCMFREIYGVSHAEAFFYTSVYQFLLPLLLVFASGAIMGVAILITQYMERIHIKQKLNLLEQLRSRNMQDLADQLIQGFENDRILLIFRYIPLPHLSGRKLFLRFLEDMIPLIVTALFFAHTTVTRSMLQMLDCRSYDLGQGIIQEVLSAAPSIVCEKFFGAPYVRYLIVGLMGFFLWGLGIPIISFIVLYHNRKTLTTVSMRLRYGFLHNGYLATFWWWETIIYFRKVCALILSVLSMTFGTLSITSTKLWLAIIIATVFGASHLIAQPFDERNYSILNRLEDHSMGSWTLSLILCQLASLGSLSAGTNLTIFLTIVSINFFFLAEIAVAVFYAYSNTVRLEEKKLNMPVFGWVFRKIANASETARQKEATIVFKEMVNHIKIIPGRQYSSVASSWLRNNPNSGDQKRTILPFSDKKYFIAVMAEALRFALVHLKLSYLPGDFLEFVVRMGLINLKIEQDTHAKQVSMDALARGDLSKLSDWKHMNEEEEDRNDRAKIDAREKQRGLKRIDEKTENEPADPLVGDAPDTTEQGKHVQDNDYNDTGMFDSGANQYDELDDENWSDDNSDSSSSDDTTEVANVQDTTEGDFESYYLFNEEVLSKGITLSDLYLSLFRMQLKQPKDVAKQFQLFKYTKYMVAKKNSRQVEQRNVQLKRLHYFLSSMSSPDNNDNSADKSKLSKAQNDKITALLQEAHSKLAKTRAEIKCLIEDPDSLENRNDKDWINAERLLSLPNDQPFEDDE